MRCLYCGKELALLKRWTGGGEFCTDAHRQQYQQEYNQLALNRLLQAKPPRPGEADPASDLAAEPVPPLVAPIALPAPAVSSASTTGREQPIAAAAPKAIAATPPPPMEAPTFAPAQPLAQPQTQPVAQPIAEAARTTAFEPKPEPERDRAPAELASFLLELPVPVLADVLPMARPDVSFEPGSAPALPRCEPETQETELLSAGPVEPAPFTCLRDQPARPREGKLEMRNFVRTAKVVAVNLDQAGDTRLPEMIEEPMDILILPQPPQEAPPLWEEPSLEFAFDEDLGVLARVAFRTTGVEDNEDASDPLESLTALSPAIHEAHEARHIEAKLEAIPEPDAESREEGPESEVVNGAALSEPELASEPEPAEPIAQPAFVPAPPPAVAARSTPEPEAAVAVAQEDVSQPDVEPAPKVVHAPPPVTKPLPVTLHGLAAGRGKPVQVFAAVTAGLDLQIPRSTGLPLRPVMTLGPALTGVAIATKVVEKTASGDKLPERTVIVKVDPKKSPPSRPDPRMANGKGVKDPRPAGEVKEPVKVATNKDVVAKDSVKEATKDAGTKAPEQKPAVAALVAPAATPPLWKPGEEPVLKPVEKPAVKAPRSRETILPAPLAAPYHPPDLGLPSLNLEASSGGFWKRLPFAGKAGLVLTMAALAVAIVFIMKSGTSAAAGPRVVEAPAFTEADGGWITDWGVEPGVRKVHDISVLRPSLNVADYRIQFEAQIESKALGWVFRATDAKNYYLSKLEVLKPGLEPTVALIRSTIVDGEEQARAEIPLTMPLRVDTMYKVRFDAVGDHFTTWVQDQKVDDWTDERFKTGGVGLYSDRSRGETMRLKKDTLRVAPLVVKK